MAYSKKKKRYKLNKGKKVRKAQDGLTDVVDVVTDLAGNFGGGEGLPLEDVWQGVVDTVTNLNLGNINLPSIGGTGGSAKGSSEASVSEGVPSDKTDKPSFFDRGYANLTTDELKGAFNKHYDFDRMEDMIDHDKNAMPNRFATGRHHSWSQLFHTPENVNFDYTDKQGRRVGGATNTHPANLTAMLMDIAEKDPDAIEFLMNQGYQYAPRASGKGNQGQGINKRYGLEKGSLSSKDIRFMKDLNEDKLRSEGKKLEKRLKGEGYANFSGHSWDVYEMNRILGPYLPKGFNDGKGIDSHIADFLHDAVDNKMWTDAMASMHPDRFDPGVRGVDEKGRYGAYQTRRNPGEDKDKFINAPLNYQYNLEASGLDPDQKPSQEWLRMQYMSNQGSKDGMGGYNKDEIAQMLMQDEQFLAENNLKTSDLARSPLGYAQTSGNLYRFGVTWDDKNKKWYSEGTKDFLTPKQAERWTSAITDKYIEDSGWQQYSPDSKIESVNIGTVPSNKIDETISRPSGPMSFNQDDSDIESEINELTGDVQADFDAVPGPTTGGSTENVPGRTSSRADRSMKAVIDSATSGTHVVTGEGYNQADLNRDAAIIKREFGDEAYNNLLNKLSKVEMVSPGSSESVVDERGRSDRGVKKSPVSFVSSEDETGDFLSEGDEGKKEEMTAYETIQRLRFPEKFEDDEEIRESKKEESDTAQVTEGDTKKPIMPKAEEKSNITDSTFPFFSYDSFGNTLEEQQEMMARGETPMYKHGGFGKGFDMSKMKFQDGGTTFATPVAKAFMGARGSGGGGFKMPTIHGSSSDSLKDGETYLSAKISRLEMEMKKLDANNPEHQDTLAALQEEIEESKAELIAVRGGGVGARRG